MENSRTAGIYVIKCLSNGRAYVGQSIDPHKRIGQHKSFLRHGKHSIKDFQRDFDKYGECQFESEVIQNVDRLEALYQIERKVICELNGTISLYNRVIHSRPDKGIQFGFLIWISNLQSIKAMAKSTGVSLSFVANSLIEAGLACEKRKKE